LFSVVAGVPACVHSITANWHLLSNFRVLQDNIISWVTIFLSTRKPLSCSLFSYYINTAMDLHSGL
jgi:hypothetical protein